MGPRDFDVLEHPADIGFRAFGGTLPELFAHSALAMLSIAADPAAVLPKEEYPLAVESGDRAFPAGRREIPADYRAVGQPVFIPGSMGTASWVLAGAEGAMRETFGSVCHGAGRLLSRTAARKVARLRPMGVIKSNCEPGLLRIVMLDVTHNE